MRFVSPTGRDLDIRAAVVRHHELVDASKFQFDTSGVSGLSGTHHAFLDLAADVVRRTRPVDLDLDAIEVTVEKGSMLVWMPHRREDDAHLMITISDEEAVVSYGYEHEHFAADDPVNDGAGPVEAQDFVAAAARFLEQLLLGRIELEVRRGFLLQRTKSYWINHDGEREVFLRGGTVMPTLRPQPPRLIRLDFGALGGQ